KEDTPAIHTPAPPSAPEDTSILRIDEGIARFLDDEDEYFQSLAEVHGMYRHSADTPKRLLAAGQTHEARLFVHSMRGIAGNIGAPALHVAATALDELMIDPGADVHPEYVDRFCVELQRLLDEIEKILPEQKIKSTIGYHELAEILDTLLPFLQAGNPKGSKDVQKILRSKSVPADLEADLQDIDKAITSYNFTHALQAATRLRESLKKR
ncbi:MAG: Hpt domain-containing protein, partial [Desulfovibrionales bacterium]|nr:Hpt domain-containing protein [Desulfovibrionales bacterium]